MAKKLPPLEDDPRALEAIDMAIEQAKQLRRLPRRSPSVWLCCLELARIEVAAGRPPKIPADAVATSLGFDWHVRYFRECEEWHSEVVAPELRRRAARTDLFPLGIAYDRGGRQNHVEPDLIVIRLQRLRRPNKAARVSEDPPATHASPETPASATVELVQSPPDVGTRVSDYASTPSSEADEQVLEERFIARFGFDAPAPVREQVLRLKRANQWTDRNIRYLRRTGALTVSRQSVVVCKPSLWMISIGVLFLGMMVLPLVHALLAFYLMPARDLWGMTTVLGVLLAYLGICWGIYYVFIRPFLFLLRGRQNRPR